MRKQAKKKSTLGRRIIRARESLDLTTAQLARRLGVQTGTLSNWETDTSEPRANQLVTLAGMTNVSLSWLMMGRGGGPMVHTLETELTHLRTSLLDLKTQTENTAVRIDELVQRIDELRETQEDNNA